MFCSKHSPAPSDGKASRSRRVQHHQGDCREGEDGPLYVGDMLRLTLLAPDIIEMILDGRQPPTLQFEALRKSMPLVWDEQRRASRTEG